MRTDRLDPAIVALDGIGLLFFFIPGVIAFAVDFSTGAIYLPPDEFSSLHPAPALSKNQVRIDDIPATPSRTEIESIVQKHTGKVVDLRSPTVQVVRLNSLDEIPPTARRISAQRKFSVDEQP